MSVAHHGSEIGGHDLVGYGSNVAAIGEPLGDRPDRITPLHLDDRPTVDRWSGGRRSGGCGTGNLRRSWLGQVANAVAHNAGYRARHVRAGKRWRGTDGKRQHCDEHRGQLPPERTQSSEVMMPGGGHAVANLEDHFGDDGVDHNSDTDPADDEGEPKEHVDERCRRIETICQPTSPRAQIIDLPTPRRIHPVQR